MIFVICLAASDSNDSNSGAITGGIIGSIALLFIVVLILVLYLYYRRRKHIYHIKQKGDSEPCMLLHDAVNCFTYFN